MHRTRIPVHCHVVGLVHGLRDAFTSAHGYGVFGDWLGDPVVVHLFEPTSAIAFQSAGAGDEDHRRPLEIRFRHRRDRVGESLRTDQAHDGFSVQSCPGVGHVSSHLFMGKVHNGNLVLHQTLEHSIYETTAEGIDHLYLLLGKRFRQQYPAPDLCRRLVCAH